MFQAIAISRNIRERDNDSNLRLNSNKTMEKGAKIWHIIATALGLAITLVTGLINQSTKIERQQVEIQYLKEAARDHGLILKEQSNRIEVQYKEIMNTLTDMKVTMQNKQDKK